MTKNIERFGLLLCLSLGTALSGCGDDASTAPGDASLDASNVDRDSGGDSSLGPVPGFDAGPLPVFTCGSTACEMPVYGMPCCTAPGTGEVGNGLLENAGRAANLCGTDVGGAVPALLGVCLQMNQPGEATTDCPDITTDFATEPGCCTDQGYCGSVNTNAGLGCEISPLTGKGKRCGSGDDGGTDGGELDGGN